MTRGFFITGTGTGVGKTFISVRLAEEARARGQRVFAFKPIETGCRLVDGVWIGEDQEHLAIAAGDWQQGELRRLYNFELPRAPSVAARAVGQPIDLMRVHSTFERGVSRSDFVIVEGAGGWRVPVTNDTDMGSLAKMLALPIVVVAPANLGTINHSVLTVEAVQRDGCRVAAVVLSFRPEDDLDFAHENAVEIERLSGARTIVSCEKVLYDTL